MLTERAVIAIVTPPTTKVPGLFVQSMEGFYEVTAEAAILLLREAYHNLPRVVELKHKWEQRMGA